jgi:hypothetical protein
MVTRWHILDRAARVVAPALALALAGLWLVQPAAQTVASGGSPASTTLDDVFTRLYNVDFAGAHEILDRREADDPTDPLTFSVRAVTDLYAEMQRLEILETEFFVDDDKVTSEERLEPDPAVRDRIVAAIDQARRLADQRLLVSNADRDALFALCMSANVMTDYTALVERRQLTGLRMAREVHRCAQRLLALDPPVYDAHQAMGVIEYINSKVPFFIRWFVRFPDIDGSEDRAIEHLEIVVRQGRYYGPFARVLLAVLHLRGDRPEEARSLLAGLAQEFPDNPLFPKEIARIDARIRSGG